MSLCVACSAPSRGDAAPAEPSASPQSTVPAAEGASTVDTRMLEQPAVSKDRIAFVYAGDLWTSKLDGSDVRRLTSHPGPETLPHFSPDGKWIAFSGQYDGNTDVYIVPVEGGEPRRLTWHPGADLVQGFTPDGEGVVFVSQRDVYTRRFWHLFRVDLHGGFPTSYGLPTCAKAALSPDGKKIAYNPLTDAFTQWKHYRGGTASRIWIYDIGDRTVVQVPQPKERCNDTDATWVRGQLYFRSDRAGEFNLFSYDPASNAVTQCTKHTDFPVLSLGSSTGYVVYEQAGYLHFYDPARSAATRLHIGVPAELVETRPRFVKGADYVRSADVSPSGSRVAIGFRGEIVTVPAEKGDPRNLTNSPAVNERYPAWSPDGKTIAWFSDESGENQLVLAPQDGHGARRAIALEGAGFYVDPKWSPDGKKISYVDNARALFVLDVESGKSTRVAQDPIYGVLSGIHHDWSPDSRWLAYTVMNTTGFHRVEIYDVLKGASTAITDGLSDASDAVFDTGGKYLYLAASTDAGPALTWFSQASADVAQTNALYLVCLAKDTPSPLAKESDEEKLAAPEKPEEKKEDKKEEKKDDDKKKEEKKAVDVAIDFEGLAQRIVALPIAKASFTGLRCGESGQLFYLKSERSDFAGNPNPGALTRFDLKERKEKKLLDGVRNFTLTRDHKKVLFGTDDGSWVTALGDSIDKSKGKLALDSIQVRIDPRAEWRQIFDEAWRINRDYFYDPKMHGADWAAMKERYAQFLPHLATRRDLSRVIGWLCSELVVGHSRGGGGDTLVKTDQVPGGLLGADYAIEDGHYRFKKVYGGLNWTPDLRAPLTEPGVQVHSGDYLLAVEGRDLAPPENLYARFENTAGKQIELTVGPNADGTGSRTVKVVPIADESALRNRDWVEGNIAKVTAATGGKVAYVYVPNTAELGFEYFKRYFFPQSDRQAIIVDERHNGGGSVADYYIDILRRPYVSHWATRYGASIVTPQAAIFGPKVMLIDETAGSGGDLLPWMFRKFKLGKLIGRPTWGGLVGILGFPELMDGGNVTAPNIGIWTEEEGFTVENVGVPPDIEVEQSPALVQDGHDPQLERAIQEVLADLEKNPPHKAVQPPFPVRVPK
ncbi:MAG TPA: PDZ domain-containing protein [Planctomycetota bacterium]|jgi:tricorn protease|nr:PDZ domain-containing protein [Planctomycetota bacterium]